MLYSQNIWILVFFCEFTYLKICGIITDIIAYWKLYFDCFFRILGSSNMKFGQTLLQLVQKNLACFYPYWRDWKIVSDHFMTQIKWQYSQYFLTVSLHTLKTAKNPQTHHNWFLTNCSKLVNSRGPWFRTQSSKSCKIFPKNIIHDFVYYVANFHD